MCIRVGVGVCGCPREAARSPLKGRVNLVLSRSNKLHPVAVQGHKEGSSGCLATVWPWRDQTALLPPPHAPHPQHSPLSDFTQIFVLVCVWESQRKKSLCGLCLFSSVSHQLGLHWKLSKRKCESSNMMEYVSWEAITWRHWTLLVS